MKTKWVGARIEPDIYDEFVLHCEQNHLGTGELMRELILEELKKQSIVGIYQNISEHFNQIDTKFSALYGVWLTLQHTLQKCLIMVECDAHARQTCEKLSESKLHELESTIEAESKTLYLVEKEIEEWKKGLSQLKKRSLNE